MKSINQIKICVQVKTEVTQGGQGMSECTAYLYQSFAVRVN
jgi:hypothetical protein